MLNAGSGQADDAVWNEPSDGANGADADHHTPGRAGNNPAARTKSGSSLMKALGRTAPGRGGRPGRAPRAAGPRPLSSLMLRKPPASALFTSTTHLRAASGLS